MEAVKDKVKGLLAECEQQGLGQTDVMNTLQEWFHTKQQQSTALAMEADMDDDGFHDLTVTGTGAPAADGAKPKAAMPGNAHGTSKLTRIFEQMRYADLTVSAPLLTACKPGAVHSAASAVQYMQRSSKLIICNRLDRRCPREQVGVRVRGGARRDRGQPEQARRQAAPGARGRARELGRQPSRRRALPRCAAAGGSEPGQFHIQT
jgi:hypothetical protein